MNKSTSKQNLAVMNAERVKLADKVYLALIEAGFEVTSNAAELSTTSWSDLLTIVGVNDLNQFEFSAHIRWEIRRTSWMSDYPTKLGVGVVLNDGTAKNRKLTFTKLDDKWVKRVVSLIQECLTDARANQVKRREKEKEVSQWTCYRSKTLKGLVVPPGATIKVTSGDGPDAGKFVIDFKPDTFRHCLFTKEGLEQFVITINDLLKVNDFYVVTRTLDTGSETALAAGGWWSQTEPALFKSTKEAEEAVIAAEKLRAWSDTSFYKIKPYTEWAAIK